MSINPCRGSPNALDKNVNPVPYLDVLRFSRLGGGPRMCIFVRYSGILMYFQVCYPWACWLMQYYQEGLGQMEVIRGGIWKEELPDILTKPKKSQGTRTTKGLTTTTSCPRQWSGRVNSLLKFFSEVPILPYEYGYCLYKNTEGECSEATYTHYNCYCSHTFIIIILLHQTFGIFPIVKHSVHTVSVH